MRIHSWNHTYAYARVVAHELGMSCLAKNNLSLSPVGKPAGTQVYNHKKKPDLRMSDSMCGDRAFMFQMAFP